MISALDSTLAPRYQRALHHEAAELRELAEHHPGVAMCHFMKEHRLVFVTRHERGEWLLRIAHTDDTRPDKTEIEFWREWIGAPDAARVSTGYAIGGFAALVVWDEIEQGKLSA